MDYTLTLVPGDGIGKEVSDAVLEVLSACGMKIKWEIHHAGQRAVDEGLPPLPQALVDSIRKNKVALKGPLTTPVGSGFQSVNVALRKKLNLYACVRPVTSLCGVETPWKDVDLVVIRENTEGLYAGMEHLVTPDVAVGFRVLSREATEKIAHFSYRYARENGRRKITFAHKRAAAPLAERLFAEWFLAVSENYPFIETEVSSVDRVAMGLTLDPTDYDVLVFANLFGDIFSDLCAGLVGGLGVVPGSNIGDSHAVFEAVHGSAPDIAGQGVANPTALLFSAALLLDYIGEKEVGARVRKATSAVLSEGGEVTRDLGGTASTAVFTQAVIQHLDQ